MYSTFAKLAHWTILVLAIVQFPTAQAIQRTHVQHPFGLVPSRFDLFLHAVHAWSGWVIGLLSLVLLIQRLRGKAPLLPGGMKAWQVRVSKLGHFLLYAVLAGLVVTGTGAMYLWSGFRPVHEVLLWSGVALVVLHVAAAVWHQFIRRDGLIWRLMPLPTRRDGGDANGR
ncbi:MAG: cytochrome b/b6 domain-containing protein [Bauldia sp.]|nr:cytochrome b/b6 domain-containing protein [Bauldia sp.]